MMGVLRRFSFPVIALLEPLIGNRRHTDAKAETMGYARASHRAFDWQQRCRLGSAVVCPALRRCVLGARFQQWSFQRPFVTISNRRTGRSIPNGISDKIWASTSA